MKHKGIWLINGLLALFAVPIAVMILIVGTLKPVVRD